MLKREITFLDLDGNPVTDTFYFHLSKATMIRMESMYPEGLKGYLDAVVATNDKALILATFENLIRQAYGIRHEDNRQFVQSDALSDAFMQTDAYSEFIMDILSDPMKAASFVADIVPADMREGLSTLEETEQKIILDVPVESLSPQLAPPGPVIDPPKPKTALGLVKEDYPDPSKMNEAELRAFVANQLQQ